LAVSFATHGIEQKQPFNRNENACEREVTSHAPRNWVIWLHTSIWSDHNTRLGQP
jgi:hypothetical protein